MKKMVAIILFFAMLLTMTPALAEDATLTNAQCLVEDLRSGDITYEVWLDSDGDEWITIPLELENWNIECDVDCIFYAKENKVSIAMFDMFQFKAGQFDEIEAVCNTLNREQGKTKFWAEEEDNSVDFFYSINLAGVSDVGGTVVSAVVEAVELVEESYSVFSPVLQGTSAAADGGESVSLNAMLVEQAYTPKGFADAYNNFFVQKMLRWQLPSIEEEELDSMVEAFSITYSETMTQVAGLPTYEAPIGYYVVFSGDDVDADSDMIMFMADFSDTKDLTAGSMMQVFVGAAAIMFGADSEDCDEAAEWALKLLTETGTSKNFKCSAFSATFERSEDSGYVNIIFVVNR